MPERFESFNITLSKRPESHLAKCLFKVTSELSRGGPVVEALAPFVPACALDPDRPQSDPIHLDLSVSDLKANGGIPGVLSPLHLPSGKTGAVFFFSENAALFGKHLTGTDRIRVMPIEFGLRSRALFANTLYKLRCVHPEDGQDPIRITQTRAGRKRGASDLSSKIRQDLRADMIHILSMFDRLPHMAKPPTDPAERREKTAWPAILPIRTLTNSDLDKIETWLRHAWVAASLASPEALQLTPIRALITTPTPDSAAADWPKITFLIAGDYREHPSVLRFCRIFMNLVRHPGRPPQIATGLWYDWHNASGPGRPELTPLQFTGFCDHAISAHDKLAAISFFQGCEIDPQGPHPYAP